MGILYMVYDVCNRYGESFPVSEAFASNEFVLPIGQAKIEREGSDCTIVAHSLPVGHALTAAAELAKEGINCEVCYLSHKKNMIIFGSMS